MESTSSAGIQGNTQQVQQGQSVYNGVSTNQLQNGAGSSAYGSGATSSMLDRQLSGQLNVENVSQGQPMSQSGNAQQAQATTSGRTDAVMFIVLGVAIVLVALTVIKLLSRRSGNMQETVSHDLEPDNEPSKTVPTVEQKNAPEAVKSGKQVKKKTPPKKKHKKKSRKR